MQSVLKMTDWFTADEISPPPPIQVQLSYRYVYVDV
jgi:hypothetical protein